MQNEIHWISNLIWLHYSLDKNPDKPLANMNLFCRSDWSQAIAAEYQFAQNPGTSHNQSSSMAWELYDSQPLKASLWRHSVTVVCKMYGFMPNTLCLTLQKCTIGNTEMKLVPNRKRVLAKLIAKIWLILSENHHRPGIPLLNKENTFYIHTWVPKTYIDTVSAWRAKCGV